MGEMRCVRNKGGWGIRVEKAAMIIVKIRGRFCFPSRPPKVGWRTDMSGINRL